jgi:hypothetical protein
VVPGRYNDTVAQNAPRITESSASAIEKLTRGQILRYPAAHLPFSFVQC